MSTVDIWHEILKELEEVVGRPNYITWLKPTTLTQNTPEIATILVPNPYNKEWLENNLIDVIKSKLVARLPELNEVRITIKPRIEEDLPELPILQISSPKDKAPVKKINPLKPGHTLETFIVGNSNRLAFAAAQAVAQKPGGAYNPLFIYGGVGLGKTHLMHAIGNEILKNDTTKTILYSSCETFTSEFVQALQEKTISDFKKRYRTADVLLIDDIQFLSNKEGTQEEFFHTFNILHQANRQIVVTSDRVPKDIPYLEERLSSRFGWGMVADIQPPNYETRVAILQAKAKERHIEIDSQSIDYIAQHIVTNIRELEGSLTRLLVASRDEDKPITRDFVEIVLKDFLKHETQLLSPKKIIRTVAKYYEVELQDLLGNRRTKELVTPRQITMFLMRDILQLTYPQIGDLMGGKDHTTVIYSVDKVRKGIKKDPSIEADISAITQLLKD